MNGYKGYLFDLDGTLIDTAPDINIALNHCLAAHQFTAVTEAHTRHWVGHGAKVLIERALETQLQATPDPGQVEQLRQGFIEYYEAHIADHSRAYPGVVGTLEMLRSRGARLAVVTNKISQLSHHLLEALAISHLFDTVVGGDTAARPKPAPDPALHACRELGLEITDVLFVGDAPPDVGCARAAGCAVVCVRDGYNQGIAAEALGADAVIESFLDLV